MSAATLDTLPDVLPSLPSLASGTDLYRAAAELVLSDAEQLLKRFLLDEIEKAVPFTWLRRAVVFDAVPLPEVAAACRRHAALLFCQLDPARDLLDECERLGVARV